MKLNSSQKKIILKNRITFLLVILFIYVALFEFILPVNKILPKPSLLVESIPALFSDYNLFSEMAVTTSVIYAAIGVAFMFVWLISFQLSKLIYNNSGVFNNLRLFKNFPAFFFAILMAFWFNESVVAEFIFALLISTHLLIKAYLKTARVPDEYLDAALSLGLKGKNLNNKVIWKYSLPGLMKELPRIHYYLWVLVLIYEFVGNFNGFGAIYQLSLEYKDFSVIILLGIIIALLIWLGNSIIVYLQNKLVNWKV